MRIKSIRLENFRSFEDETMNLDDYTCFVGQNGSGKSTVLTALNIFFRETSDATTDLVNLSGEDFHNRNTAVPIRITITFSDLSSEAQEDFKGYYRQNHLVVSAEAEWKGNGAVVKQFGQRMVMSQFQEFFKQKNDGALVAQLRGIYTALRTTFNDLPNESTKDRMEQALRQYEEDHPNLCSLTPSEDNFYGVSKGANRLAKYIQWVYIPAVKDASAEQADAKGTALGKLLQRRVHSQISLDEPVKELQKNALAGYQAILDQNKTKLEELSVVGYFA